MLQCDYLKYCPSLATTLSHLSDSIRFLRKNESIGQPGHALLVRKGDNPKERYLGFDNFYKMLKNPPYHVFRHILAGLFSTLV